MTIIGATIANNLATVRRPPTRCFQASRCVSLTSVAGVCAAEQRRRRGEPRHYDDQRRKSGGQQQQGAGILNIGGVTYSPACDAIDKRNVKSRQPAGRSRRRPFISNSSVEGNIAIRGPASSTGTVHLGRHLFRANMVEGARGRPQRGASAPELMKAIVGICDFSLVLEEDPAGSGTFYSETSV